MNISIACGGTGGHLFPGLAVAEVLRQRGNVVTLWLDQRAVDSARGSGWDGEIETIKATGISGVSFKAIGTAFQLMRSVVTCRQRMRHNKPDVVLAMGSYASFGPVVAARLCRVPVVLHEANAIPGRTISLLSRFANVVALTFSECSRYFKCRTVLTGFPVRDDIIPHFPDDTVLKKGVFTVLIMGGSQGAHKLNELGSDAICTLKNKGVDLQVIHLSGEADAGIVRRKYEAAGINIGGGDAALLKGFKPRKARKTRKKEFDMDGEDEGDAALREKEFNMDVEDCCSMVGMVYPFLKDMGIAYGVADLAVCRAGASTCMELAAFELPALLVPLPSARRDHQMANAKVFAGVGAADYIAQNDLFSERLAEYINMFVDDASLLIQKKRCLKDIAMPDAAVRIADLVEEQNS